jgi:hypothetical protein
MVTATRYGYFRDAFYYLACSEHLAWGYVDQPPLVFGAIAGVGLENKYSIAAFAFFLLAGLLLTPQRKFLCSPWILAGGFMALLLFLPNLLWNIEHHWPFLELVRNIRASGRDVVLSPLVFLAQQILIMTPATLPFWLGGLWFYFSNAGKKFRVLGWTFIFTTGFFLLTHGKNYYSAPVYPLVLAAGAVAAEKFLNKERFEDRPRMRSAFEVTIFGWLAVGILLLLPVVLPVLPIEGYLRYQAHLPFVVPKSEHNQDTAILPQHYADEFGWEDMVSRVAEVYHSLSPEEQSRTAIFASNYGEAGAIDFFGSRYGSPKAICTHQNYFLWGPRNYTGGIIIRIGTKPQDARESYESVGVAATLDNPYTMPHEKNPILLCRHRKKNLQTDWPDIKNWD